MYTIFFELFFNFDFIYNFNIYLYIYTIFFAFNFFLNDSDNSKNFNLDLSFKYLILFYKLPSYLINYFFLIIKKIYLFLVYFKYRNFINTCKFIFKTYFYNYFIVWRPIFKKISYFGYYRSNRSKWIK